MQFLNAHELGPEARFRELATILALGVIRRQQRVAVGAIACSQKLGGILPACLEVSNDTVLSVTNPVNGPESLKPGALA